MVPDAILSFQPELDKGQRFKHDALTVKISPHSRAHFWNL